MDRSGTRLTTSYDADADVLYLSFGEPVPAYGEHLDEDVVLRHALDDDRIVGITVIGFRQMGGVDALIERLQRPVTELRIPLILERAEELREMVAPPSLS